MRHARTIRLCVFVAILAALAVFPTQASNHRPSTNAVVLHGLAPPVYAPTEKLILTITDSRRGALPEVMDALRDAGGRRLRVFDPDLIIGDFPLGADLSAVQAMVPFRVQRKQDVRPGQTSLSGARPYQLVRDPLPARPKDRALLADMNIAEICGAREAPVMPADPAATPNGAAAAAASRKFNQNALLMAGRILVNVVLPESQDPRWTDGQIADVLEQVNRAMDGFDRDARRSQLDIVFVTHKRASVYYDPTWYQPGSDRYWIARVMNSIGGSSAGTSIEMTHRYNEQKRVPWQADWAFMMLIANSTNRENLLFRDSREIAWGVIGGPYMVCPYPAGGLQGVAFQSLLRHEIGHIFWALDETANGKHTCEDISGYLRYENLNRREVSFGIVTACDGLPISCPMDMGHAVSGYTGPICHFTQGMVGVVDADDNDVPDALDAPPVVGFIGAEQETLFTALGEIHVEAWAQSLTNRNPRIPSVDRLDVVAPLLDLEISITYAQPYVFTPEDVGSDGSNIVVRAPIPSMFPGWNDVDAVARNIFLSESEPVRKSYLYVNLDFTSFELLHPRDEGVHISWLVRGETFGAHMEVFRRNKRTGEEVRVAAGVQPSGPPDVGHTPYQLTDLSLEPGTQYDYFIRGTINIDYRGELVTVVRESPIISTQAAVPRATSVSNLAPNPFNPARDEFVWLSVTLPQGAQTLVQTSVELGVFDIAGRRVATIADGNFLGDAETFSWNGMTDRGRPAPAGFYFFRLVAGEETATRKMLLIR